MERENNLRDTHVPVPGEDISCNTTRVGASARSDVLYLRGAAKEGEGRSTLKRRSSSRRHKNIALAFESPIAPLDTDQVCTYHNNK